MKYKKKRSYFSKSRFAKVLPNISSPLWRNLSKFVVSGVVVIASTAMITAVSEAATSKTTTGGTIGTAAAYYMPAARHQGTTEVSVEVEIRTLENVGNSLFFASMQINLGPSTEKGIDGGHVGPQWSGGRKQTNWGGYFAEYTDPNYRYAPFFTPEPVAREMFGDRVAFSPDPGVNVFIQHFDEGTYTQANTIPQSSFDWQTGRNYRFTVSRGNNKQGFWTYNAWAKDLSTGTDYFLGALYSKADHITSMPMWTETGRPDSDPLTYEVIFKNPRYVSNGVTYVPYIDDVSVHGLHNVVYSPSASDYHSDVKTIVHLNRVPPPENVFKSVSASDSDWDSIMPEAPTPAPAPAGSTFTLVNANSGKCVNIFGGVAMAKDGTNIAQWDCNNAPNLWEEVPTAGGFMLRNTQTKKCLDIPNASTANGANVHLWTCVTNAPNQTFNWYGNSLGFKHSGKCIDVANASTSNGANLQQWSCDGGPDQSFTRGGSTTSPAPEPTRIPVQPIPTAQPDAGVGFTLVNANSDKCVNIFGGVAMAKDGTNIAQWDCNNAPNLWEEVPTAGGFMLRNTQTKKCLDIPNASTVNGANVHLWTCVTNAPNQTFTWYGNALRFKHSGKCIEVAGSSTSNGGNLVQWTCHGRANQSFGKNDRPASPAPAPTTAPAQPVPTARPDAGVGFTLVNANSGKCVNIFGGVAVAKDGTNIAQWDCNNAPNLWEEVPTAGGFMLRNTQTKKCLDIPYASTANGANVHLWTCHTGAANQTFTWYGNALRFKHSGKCFEVAGSSTSNGGNLVQWTCHGRANQSFSKGGSGSLRAATLTSAEKLIFLPVVAR